MGKANNSGPSILLVDDRKENLLALEAILDAPGLNIFTATSGNEALGLMLEHEFAIVLLDVQMPEMDGFEVADLMRQNERTRFIPIIFVTAINKEERYISKGYETGGVDYLFKPLDPAVLKSKINTFLELYRHKKELEKSKQQIEKQNERLKEISIRDGLTGLYNHRYFQEILNREFALARRNQSDIACFMIDLDYFKDVNDTFGHAFGDFVLQSFSALIRGIIRKTDVLARYGGEEFVLLLPHTGIEGARILAEKFRQKAEENIYKRNGHSRKVTSSIGISSFFTHSPSSASELVDYADKALYRAKAGGRNQVKIYREEELVKRDSSSGFELPHDDFIGLKERFKKIVETSRDAILASLSNLAQHPINSKSAGAETTKKIRENNLRTMEILDLMGERLGLPFPLVQTFKRAALIHDLFKIYLGDETAQKDTPLTKQEKLDIYDYPYMLEELTRIFDIFSDERTILRYHHENYDGSGYPESLKGDEVPIGARLFALVDAFVAMSSGRPYRPTLTAQEVITELEKQSGHQFDPMLVKLLLELVNEKKLPVNFTLTDQQVNTIL